METKYLKINPADNVAVAIQALNAGETITIDGQDITVLQDTPAGHKVMLTDLNKGEDIIKYGYPIGHATEDVKKGQWVNENQTIAETTGLLEYT